jgi:hypothetical protein
MFRMLFGSTPTKVEFCDGRGTVCDDRCRSDTLLDQARTRALEARLGG